MKPCVDDMDLIAEGWVESGLSPRAQVCVGGPLLVPWTLGQVFMALASNPVGFRCASSEWRRLGLKKRSRSQVRLLGAGEVGGNPCLNSLPNQELYSRPRFSTVTRLIWCRTPSDAESAQYDFTKNPIPH